MLDVVVGAFPELTRDQKLQIYAIVHWQAIKFIQEVEDLGVVEDNARPIIN